MEDKQELRTALEKLEESNKQQAHFTRLQCWFSLISALCCAVILFLLWSLMPQITQIGAQAEQALTDMQATLTNLEIITDQLAEADLGTMANNVDTLVTTSQTGVEEALKKLNGIDFDTLNEAIRNLADVVEPLAKFFNVFNR